MYLLPFWLVAMSIVAFAVFGLDKWLATRRKHRVRESHLLLLALLGGSPGAFLAMWTFRHKISKRAFRLWMYVIIALQIVLAFLVRSKL